MKILMIMLGVTISLDVAASEENSQDKPDETSLKAAEKETTKSTANPVAPLNDKMSSGVSVVETASPKDRPLRPITHPGDPALSDSPVENFQKLYCEPSSIAAALSPTTSIEDSSNVLLIPNRYNGWVDVSVAGERIGRLGPLTTGALHNLKAGIYTVELQVENMQYVATEYLKTTSLNQPLSPGNKAAGIAGEEGYQKPGLGIHATKRNSGSLIRYILP